MPVILMAIFPVLFFLVLDWIFKGTSHDYHTLETLGVIVHSPWQVIAVVIGSLVFTVIMAFALAWLDKLRRKE